MIVMTYNVCSGWNNEKSRTRSYDAACRVIETIRPDIVALNEIGNKPIAGIDSHSGYMALKLGMKEYFAPAITVNGYPYGNALLSKYDILSAEKIMIPDPPKRDGPRFETRNLLVSFLKTELGKVAFLVSHFGLHESERENAVKTVCDTIDKIKSEEPQTHIILAGDFNMQPDDPMLVPISDRLTEASIWCGTPYNTFESPEPKIKIDYIFISDSLEAIKVIRPLTMVSDHCPLAAYIKLK
jgi:endonuclease/exonuclease/phosphatase family metal-dependent hydrolase